MLNGRDNDGDTAQIALHLLDAVRKTQESLRCVEIWASALTAFSQPVPEYHPDMTHILPARPHGETNGHVAGGIQERNGKAPSLHSS